MSRRPGRGKIGGQFSWRLVEMMESPAFRVLSLSARRLLDRIEVELAHHGGDDNGRLPVTYEQFADYGMDRDCVSPAIRECVALGFLEVTEHGRAGNAEYRTPNLYRLTYRETRKNNATDNWRGIQSMDEAQAIARASRGQDRKARKKIFGRGFSVVSDGVSPTEKQPLPDGVSPSTGHSRKTPSTSISREGAGNASTHQAANASGPQGKRASERRASSIAETRLYARAVNGAAHGAS